MKHIIGIDPGLTGAVALIRESGVAYLWDTPTIAVKKGKKNSGKLKQKEQRL